MNWLKLNPQQMKYYLKTHKMLKDYYIHLEYFSNHQQIGKLKPEVLVQKSHLLIFCLLLI